MKTTRFLFNILTCLSLVGCATAPGYIGPNEVSASPLLMSKRLQYRGFSLVRPAHQGWFIKVSEQTPPHAIVRCHLSSRTHTAYVTADLRSLPRTATSPADFAELCRQDHFHDTNRFTVVSYQQHPVTIQGQWAIEFELTVRDSGAPNSSGQPLTMLESGYVINHPAFPNSAVLMMYSERGLPEELDPHVQADGKDILQGIRLESEPGKPLS
jgi:hypothetical protein